MCKEKVKHIFSKYIGKPIAYLLLLSISFGIIIVFVKNPDKLPDLIITLVGGAVAGFIGFYASRRAYLEQSKYEEEKQKSSMIKKLQSELENNLNKGKSFKNTSRTDYDNINCSLLDISAWEKISKTNYINIILKDNIDEFKKLYENIEKYNRSCTSIRDTKKSYDSVPTNPSLAGKLQGKKDEIDKVWKNDIKDLLENCNRKLEKITD